MGLWFSNIKMQCLNAAFGLNLVAVLLGMAKWVPIRTVFSFCYCISKSSYKTPRADLMHTKMFMILVQIF